MNILLVGSGARECAILKKLINDGEKINAEFKIVCIGTNKNPYIVAHSEFYLVDNLDLPNLEKMLNKLDFILDYAIVGPENPLECGYADFLLEKDIKCFGPLKKYATIETSKIFTRNFIKSSGLGHHSPKCTIIEPENYSKEDHKTLLKEFNEVVVKKDGLCKGKGVKVENVDFLREDIFEEIKSNHETILIEDKLIGEEFSLMTITDGHNNMWNFPPIQDYKRLYDDDHGPNTGGMGCFIDKNNTLPFLNEDDITTAQNINKIIINNLNILSDQSINEIGYVGVLYGSFMKCGDKIYIIEFNCRYGDPECILGLELLKTNYYQFMKDLFINKNHYDLEFSNDAALGVYLVPYTYPKYSLEKYDIYIDLDDEHSLYYANVEKYKDHLYSQNSRSLILVNTDSDLYSCYHELYSKILKIHGNLYYRKDIASRYLSNYEKSGVSIDKGNECVKSIKSSIQSTYNDNVLGKHGDFGGQYSFNNKTLVASIDGVGTKSVFVSRFLGKKGYKNLGMDIVNHSVNDILVQGAYPLFFLDYYGTGTLNREEFQYFISGLSDACIKNGQIPILGGETAEMPIVYCKGKTDLVGCIIGEKDDNFFGEKIYKGDKLIALPSNGPHTNGYSLINRIFSDNSTIPEEILEKLLNPHTSYIGDVKEFINNHGYKSIKAMAHITGGGLKENLLRVIPSELDINLNHFEFPLWAFYLMEKGNISREEMLRVFNCGIGYVLIVSPETYNKISNDFIDLGNII